MPSLTDLSAQWDQLDYLLLESGGEVWPEVQVVLDELLGAEKSKVDGYAFRVKVLEASAKAMTLQIEELAAKLNTTESKRKWLMDRMADYTRTRGLEKVEGEVWRFAWQANGGEAPVNITALVEDIPPRYHRVKITADKDALRAALERGEVIPGVTLGERGKSLRLK